MTRPLRYSDDQKRWIRRAPPQSPPAGSLGRHLDWPAFEGNSPKASGVYAGPEPIEPLIGKGVLKHPTVPDIEEVVATL